MDIFLYRSVDSFYHGLDPRTKMLLVAGGLVLFLFSYDLLYIIILSILTAICLVMTKAYQNLRRVWFILVTIAVFTMLIWSTITPGEKVIWRFITEESVIFATMTTLKIVFMILWGLVFLSTTRNEEIIFGLVKVRIPYPLAFAFSTALRLVPTFLGAGATVAQAQRSRGLELGSGNIFQRIKRYIPLLAPIFLISLRNTDQLAMALESKGFGRKGKRTFYLESRFGYRDLVALFLFALVALMPLIIEKLRVL